MTPPAALLDVDGLSVRFALDGGWVDAVRGVGFQLGRERLAIVGESGSGKSVTVRALLGLLPRTARVSAARMRFQGQDLVSMSPRGLRAIRGRQIAMVVQDPRQGLDPVRTIGAQIAEMLILHARLGRRAARARATDLLAEVHVRDPARVAGLYPHQVSGGMGQRAMIAMMLAGSPRVLIADEATSALDAVVQHRILDLIDEQVDRRGMGAILISHDLDLVRRHADRVLVMYAGRILEEIVVTGGPLDARHPYTMGLLACRPILSGNGADLPTLKRDPAWAA